MRESVFVHRNKERWQSFEQILNSSRSKPDELASVYIQLTDDLSFARTQYPESRTTHYLNALASKIHLTIYKNKKEDRKRFITFWKHEFPIELYHTRKQLLYALIIFTLAIFMGGVSAYFDETFIRLILGDDYVNMTLRNIENGNPMAVYGRMTESDMFFSITFNNIQVALTAFAAGLLISIGTGYILFTNGLMFGAFLTFFLKKGLLIDSLMVVMLHGTIELSSIVVAGAAGLVMGNSILFPGTYSRLASFVIGARRGMKIVIGLVPLFIMAGFIESFITRYTFMPMILKVTIIALSTLLIVYYFIIYPNKLARHASSQNFGLPASS